ncbi:MAG TPA: divergent polysaccharide deacetylase family protein [Mesorhizobium sp.]|jgi:hypothetical protein|nr:divergent polysaccharide deacetylase family protein [Mesorhizobium sp.]
MSSERDWDRPLGLDTGHARWRPDARDILTIFGALALFAAAGAVSLRERPWRVPVEAETAVAAAPAADPLAASTQAPAAPSAGPAIIKLDPAQAGQGVPAGASDGSPGGSIVVRDPAAIGQDLRTAHLPDRALVEESARGLLPARAADGRRPFDVYRRPWSGTRGARVAIVIGGLGLSQTGTQAAIRKLPPEVTLAFASEGNSLGRWMQEARRDGRELLMQVPLEPFDGPEADPGRNTLLAEGGPEENIDRLHWALGRTTNYVGAMNHMGARFTATPEAMKPFMDELGRRGLMFLDDGTSARSLAGSQAPDARVPLAVADTVIDGKRDRNAVLAKLDELERIAVSRGTALGTGSAFDATVDAVAEWAAGAKKRGVEIVPVSALAADPEGRQ